MEKDLKVELLALVFVLLGICLAIKFSLASQPLEAVLWLVVVWLFCSEQELRRIRKQNDSK